MPLIEIDAFSQNEINPSGYNRPFWVMPKDTELGTFSCIAKARVTPSKTSALETEQEFEAKDETEKYRAAPYTLPWS